MAKEIGTVINFVPDYELKPQKILTDYRIYDFLPFGADNLFPQACALFARSSPNHRGVINGKVKYITSELQTSNKKLEFLNVKVNFQGENVKQLMSKCNRDFFTGGNRYIEIITDARKSFLWFNHIDFTKVR